MWCIIPAAGIGSRCELELPKQYFKIPSGETILEKTLEVILSAESISGVITALDKDDKYFKTLSIAHQKPLYTCLGGKTRAESVFQGLLFLQSLINEKKLKPQKYVCVHDAARPLVLKEEIDLLNSQALKLKNSDGIILACEVADTIKKVKNKKIEKTIERSSLFRALTPQTIKFNILMHSLKHCLDQNIKITDEASALEACGYDCKILLGSNKNIKITYPSDLDLLKF